MGSGLGAGHRTGDGRRPGRTPSPLPRPNQNEWIPKAPPLVGVQGATPLGGFQGGALTLLRSRWSRQAGQPCEAGAGRIEPSGDQRAAQSRQQHQAAEDLAR